MAWVFEVLSWVLFVYFLLILGRVVVSWVMVMARDWRPRGAVLVVVEGMLTATDGPIRAMRKVLPPVRMGGMQFDLATMVLSLVILTLSSFVGALALGA